MKRRFIAAFALALLCVLSSSQQAHAQDVLPMRDADAIIQQQKQKVADKNDTLQDVNDTIDKLMDKKQTLTLQLQTEKQTIDDLTQKIADKKAAAEAEKARLAAIKNMFVHINQYASGSSGNLYTPGNCTWYAKSRRPDLPNNLGNANTWYANAAAQGFSVGSQAKKGAVATTTAGGLGHVAYVEGVSLDGLFVTISEMNYGGLYQMNTRTVLATEFRYIYELD